MAQTKTRKRRPVIQTFDDVLTPPLKQATFPYRRHHSTRRTIATETTPATNWRQQTLTQTTPSLSRSFSSYDGPTDLSDLEYDTLSTAMPPKKRQRTSKSDQQTITQMDPFRLQIHPEEDLEEIGDDHAEETPKTHEKPKRKRRKTTSGTPLARTIQTRSAKKQAEADIKAAIESPTVIHGSNKENLHQWPTPASTDHDALQMPPPKTPKTTRRKEIPSSQSPAVTPYSAQPRTRIQTLAASPLKERSTNVPSCKPSSSPTKTAKRRPRLKVVDSTGLQDENVEVSMPLISQYDATEGAPALSFPPRPMEIPRSSLPGTPSSRNGKLDGNTAIPMSSNTGGQGRPSLRRQGTIADSEEGDISPIRSPERPGNLQISQHEAILQLDNVVRRNSPILANSNATQPTQSPQSTTPEGPSFGILQRKSIQNLHLKNKDKANSQTPKNHPYSQQQKPSIQTYTHHPHPLNHRH
ncbi:MAG: hypothetical protein Q9212_007436 [Teloschistes hypoglaucus]